MHTSALAATALTAGAAPRRRPNIVVILCDDLGFGDISALNPTRGRIATPHCDRLVREGLSFTDAHSGSAVCTPSRYGLLTGRYCWRTRLQHGVLYGADAPLIAPDRLTVPALLRRQGYHTACFGKWHLGLGWQPRAGHRQVDSGDLQTIDYGARITGGPCDLGFDEYYGISASLDMPPYVWIEGDRCRDLPTTTKKWIREGPAAASFEAIDVLPTITQRAVRYLGQHRGPQPFFLYLPLNSPHTPILPTAEWQGRSGLNAYADFVMQTDAAVGAVLAALDEHGLADDTLVLFTSDNGCSPMADTAALEQMGHYPSAIYRGYKADIWDGGHRIPLLTRWPGVTPAGRFCHRLVGLFDLLATCAELVGEPLPATAAEDSVSFLPLLRGADQAVRQTVVHHSIDGRFAIRDERWKLILCPGSGGWSAPRDKAAREQGLPGTQLYDMIADPGERTNLAAAQPAVVARLRELLAAQIAAGRSTPGPAQANDVAVRMEP
ncbi:MAG: arylsulfatase [Fimbriimonadaceae bacterium]|nr:arylsulfatase [Fimbriimonadaceae bacterium]